MNDQRRRVYSAREKEEEQGREEESKIANLLEVLESRPKGWRCVAGAEKKLPLGILRMSAIKFSSVLKTREGESGRRYLAAGARATRGIRSLLSNLFAVKYIFSPILRGQPARRHERSRVR